MTINKPMPDIIYAWMGLQNNGSWDNEPCSCCESFEYVRADLYNKMCEENHKLKMILSGGIYG